MSDLNIGKVIIDQTKTSQVTVNYADTSKPDTSTITSNRTQMTATVDSISTAFEVSKTYYFDADGGLVTTNQGYGTLGTTDSDGVLTVAHSTPSLALTAPSAGTKYEFEESFNVTWTSSNITLVNVILESESGGYKIYEDVVASLGTLAVAISESDGFSINETVYIYIENTHQTVDDSVQVQSIATVTINSPTLTAGTEGNVTGTSNGVEVDVYYRTSSPEGSWEVFEEGVAVSGGNWSATGTIADADTYDFKAEDSTDPDGYAQVDDVVVASGVVLTALQITNASDAVTKGNTYVRYSKIVGDKIISSGTTTSSKLQIGENTYLTGVGSGTSKKRWVMCCGKNQIVDWIKFFESSDETTNQFADTYNGSVYTAECPAYTTTYDGKIKRIIIETGIVTELALSKPVSGIAYVGAVFCYDGYVYVFGSSDQYASNSILWKIAPDLSSQKRDDKTGLGRGTDAQIDATTGYIHGNSLSCNLRLAINDLRLHSSSASLVYLTKNGAFSTNNRALFSYVDSNRVCLRMLAKNDYSIVYYNQEMHGDATSAKMGAVDYDVDKFLVFHNDGAKFHLISVADSNTYSKSDIATIIPNSVIGISTFGAWLDHDSTHYLVSGSIKGVMESGFTQGDNTKYDGFIKLIEK